MNNFYNNIKDNQLNNIIMFANTKRINDNDLCEGPNKRCKLLKGKYIVDEINIIGDMTKRINQQDCIIIDLKSEIVDLKSDNIKLNNKIYNLEAERLEDNQEKLENHFIIFIQSINSKISLQNKAHANYAVLNNIRNTRNDVAHLLDYVFDPITKTEDKRLTNRDKSKIKGFIECIMNIPEYDFIEDEDLKSIIHDIKTNNNSQILSVIKSELNGYTDASEYKRYTKLYKRVFG